MDLYQKLLKYQEECIQNGALTSEKREKFDCMWKPEPSKAGDQLGYNKAADFLDYSDLTAENIGLLRRTIDALAERDTSLCRGNIPVGEENLEVALASYQAERKLFETFFPMNEFPIVYSR